MPRARKDRRSTTPLAGQHAMSWPSCLYVAVYHRFARHIHKRAAAPQNIQACSGRIGCKNEHQSEDVFTDAMYTFEDWKCCIITICRFETAMGGKPRQVR